MFKHCYMLSNWSTRQQEGNFYACALDYLSPKIFKINIRSLNISHPCKLIVTQCRWSACFNSSTPGKSWLTQHSVSLSPGLKKDPSLQKRLSKLNNRKRFFFEYFSKLSSKLILTMQSMLIKGPFHWDMLYICMHLNSWIVDRSPKQNYKQRNIECRGFFMPPWTCFLSKALGFLTFTSFPAIFVCKYR